MALNHVEHADSFPCEGESLIGIATVPHACRSLGVVVLVGGPQYRVGSHRQFALLCRRLADAGYPAYRFDYRGMGDSSGEYRTFEELEPDVRAAISRLQSFAPAVESVVLWGLCTAASTAMMYAPKDPRVAGLVLLNPWVRDETTIAAARIKHYYTARLADPQLWIKIAKGQFALRESVASLAQSLADYTCGTAKGKDIQATFQTRMAQALRIYSGRSLLLLSGNDLTAKEFLECSAKHPDWRNVLDSPRILRKDFPQADHTFSSGDWRESVENATLEWLSDVGA